LYILYYATITCLSILVLTFWYRQRSHVVLISRAGRLLCYTLLHCLWSPLTLRACNNSTSRYNAYYKARLIKVVGVFI
ncbi:uncharacterized protein M421DRAFT_413280, partial [Didymella exigua CBS 183.55]